MLRNKRYDNIVIGIGIAYVILPIVIFALGWLKLIIGIPMSALFIWLGVRLWKEITEGNETYSLLTKDTGKFWILTLAVITLWVYLSGIGSFVFQNWDYWARNPILRDLCNFKWPVVYDLSKEPTEVQAICGSSKVAFSYYFAWWLPVAAVSKVFHFSEVFRNVALYVWAFVGVVLVIYLICRKLNKCSWIIPACFIFFSGLDYIPKKLMVGELDPTLHLERWTEFFQYSSNTTLLFWVFNQAIPVWIIMGLFLQLKKNSNVAALSSLAFAYSPWATIGIVPIAFVASLKKGKFSKIFHPVNLIIPVIMLVVFGSLYTGGYGSDGKVGPIFLVYSTDDKKLFMSYLMFILFEALVYFFILGKHAYKYELYGTVLAELIIIPLFVIQDSNFVMRGSIPALFMLNFYVMSFILENIGEKSMEIRMRLAALVIALLIGAVTAVHEINRSVKMTMQSDVILQESVGSFAYILTKDESIIDLIKTQFYVYDYKAKFFFKYLAE